LLRYSITQKLIHFKASKLKANETIPKEKDNIELRSAGHTLSEFTTPCAFEFIFGIIAELEDTLYK
jgi:hypothetical protein